MEQTLGDLAIELVLPERLYELGLATVVLQHQTNCFSELGVELVAYSQLGVVLLEY